MSGGKTGPIDELITDLQLLYCSEHQQHRHLYTKGPLSVADSLQENVQNRWERRQQRRRQIYYHTTMHFEDEK